MYLSVNFVSSEKMIKKKETIDFLHYHYYNLVQAYIIIIFYFTIYSSRMTHPFSLIPLFLLICDFVAFETRKRLTIFLYPFNHFFQERKPKEVTL